MRRKLKWLAIVLAVLLLGFGTALFLWPRDRITAESWQKIRIGMTEKEVAGILGRSGMSWEESNLDTDQFPVRLRLQLAEHINGTWILDRHKYWTSQHGCMEIEFDPRGSVSGKIFWRSSERSFIDRLRDWLVW